ncbi:MULTISPECIES: MSMEG_6728 family protein [unclassified Rhodococcus (in: high G+C Gram-positive bacteria)]|uniref:MSMEG_6728 family protein n=1 Tax=unclassified Rhodococcus (in: high G+C Gram-positive bacteria) TaxID=192944 RepID=UPI0009EA3C3A|nr:MULTISPECIES: MSMEG_6728 family protein [unclassified Rhodococcus (in: high G+C Gram-positive bacteria)]
MQTFLPEPGFARSARALDDKRLGKQRVETFQILRALVWPSYGWKNHPAVVMWRGFTPALVSYGVATCREWTARGHADALEPRLLDYSAGAASTFDALRDDGRLPPWCGDDAVHAVHASHRRALAAKAPQAYPADWAGETGYVWPGSIFPTWPLPPCSGSPSAVVSVMIDMGSPAELFDVGSEEWSALRAVNRGESATVDTADPARMTLAASLVHSARTAVLRDVPALADDDVLPEPASDPGGTVSASIARVPTDADSEAMRLEGLDPARIRVFRRGQSVPDPGSYGLVVTSGAPVPPELADVPLLRV